MIKGTFSILNIIKCSAVNIGVLLAILSLKMTGQPPQALTPNYINAFAAEAINQMIEYKIPASVTLAQAIFESGCGNSELAKRSNNHFGIKCHAEWSGDTIVKDDDNYNECFRSYKTVKESYTDHSLFLKSRSRYRHLFRLRITDYRGWCKGLKNSGYATYVYYPEVLIKIIEQYALYEYDIAETLAPGSLNCQRKQELKESNLNNMDFALAELGNNNLLWNDEKDLLIQSLEMIIDRDAVCSNKNSGNSQSNTLLCSNEREIIKSKLVSTGFSLKQLAANDLLWTDERYYLIQSLEMIIDHPEKSPDLFVEK